MASAREMIEKNDFENAYIHFLNSNKRWKKHWFDACFTIANHCKEWLSKYVFDPILYTIEKFIGKIKPKNSSQKSNTYLIKMFDTCGNWVFTKIGKANDLNRRMSEFKKTKYVRQNVEIGDIEIIKSYEVPNDDSAQVLESFMRGYFKKTKSNLNFYPNDRFDAFEPTQEDLNMFENYYNLTIENCA